MTDTETLIMLDKMIAQMKQMARELLPPGTHVLEFCAKLNEADFELVRIKLRGNQ